MRVAVILLATAAWAYAQSVVDREEFAKRLRSAEKRTAEIQVELALEARGLGLYAAAWHSFRRAAELDPGNADAQRGLGRVLRDKVWIHDPVSEVPVENGRSEREISGALAKYRGIRRAHEHRIAGHWEELADFADERGLKAETQLAFRALLREFPGHSRALSRLGYTDVDGVKVSPEDTATREAYRARVMAVDGGKRDPEDTETEARTGLKLECRRSGDLTLEGQFTDGELRALVRLAAATRGEFSEKFGLTEETRPAALHGIFLRGEDDGRLWLEKASGLSRLEQDVLLRAPMIEQFDPDRFVAVRGTRPFEAARDAAVFLAARYAIRGLMQMESLPPWLAVGVPVWFTDRFCGTAYHAIPEGVEYPASTLRWRSVLRQAAWEGIDTPIRSVTRAGPDQLDLAAVMKAWSLVDWLLSARRDRLFDFLTRCRSGSSGKALQRALGADSYADLELQWEEWLDATR